MKTKKERHEKKIEKALHFAEERMELLDTIKEMVETEVNKRIEKACCIGKQEQDNIFPQHTGHLKKTANRLTNSEQ